ncbi:MAG: hypothetical protein R2708_08080 [Vicinamibacterales bacterium]
MTPADHARAPSPLRSTGWGALVGSMAGTALSLALFVLWAAYALRPGAGLDTAFDITARVSRVVSFPALPFVAVDAGLARPLSVAQALVIGLPLATWLVVGTLAGAAADILRAARR